MPAHSSVVKVRQGTPYRRLATNGGKICRLVCAALCLLLSLAHAQTTVLRQKHIYAGDIAELTIEHDAEIPSLYAIDTSVLDADFVVLDLKSRISRHYEGNKTIHRMQWKIQIVPRRSGSIRIPPLAFGDNRSEALLLEVEQPSMSMRKQQNVFIETEASPEDPYPGQQIRVTTRLFHNLPLQNVNLSEPEIEQATVFRSGKDSRHRVIRAGESFEVLERSIVLTSNVSGQLRITPASLRGLIVEGKTDAATGESGARERHVYREGESLLLQVRAKPPGFDDRPWLPARQLELDLLWDEIPATVLAGDSLGVTLSMEATGLPAEALPADLLVTDSSQYKIYADEAVRNTRIENHVDGERLVGRLRQRFVVIPLQPGALVMPALAVAWWDVGHAVERIAGVESRVVEMAASGSFNDGKGGSTDIAGWQSSASTRGLLPAVVYRHWPWLATLVIALLLVSLLLGSRQLRMRIGAKIAFVEGRRRCRQSLRRACHANDAGATRRALIEWGRLHWGDDHISGLHFIEARSRSPELTAELARLDAALYADHATAWRGQQLWKLLQQERKTRAVQVQNEQDVLPGPYPHQA